MLPQLLEAAYSSLPCGGSPTQPFASSKLTKRDRESNLVSKMEANAIWYSIIMEMTSITFVIFYWVEANHGFTTLKGMNTDMNTRGEGSCRPYIS